MEFFHGVNVNWMGKAKYFVILSLLLLAVGWISIFRTVFVKHGTLYGIDFRGGTLVYVRFAGPAPIDQIRKGLQQAGLSNSTIQGISDTRSVGSQNDVVIGLEQGQSNESLDAGKQRILDVLQKTFGAAGSGKPDFNSVSAPAIAADLTRKDPLSLGAAAGDRYTQLAARLLSARDTDHGGIVTSFDQIKSVEGATPTVVNSLRAISRSAASPSAMPRLWDLRWARNCAAKPSWQPSMLWGACWCILRSVSSGCMGPRPSSPSSTTC